MGLGDRFAQWQYCPGECGRLIPWSPLPADPRWYVLCKECNVEGYVLQNWTDDD